MKGPPGLLGLDFVFFFFFFFFSASTTSAGP